MSPAGYWPQLHAAVEAGADAVYFGLKHFTARAKVGFALSELAEVMRTLHRRGLRGYVTFNTLVFDHEMDEAARALAAIAEAGTDAIIVQDTGVAKLAREIVPGLEVHGSTQMSITSAEGVELAARLGVTRVVLARELSLDDIRAIRAQTATELEIFVHGALCVSYSGQCFSSEAWGGRSANRGQCAQACRLPYELLVDGETRPLGDARYLLSPGDLYALHSVPDIVDIGISALKIEGRYKDADYVALTTRAYRQAVDDACAGRPLSVTAEEESRIEQVYSRGLGPFFLTGTDHQAVVRGRAPRHRGVRIGKVVRVGAESVVVEGAALKPGDGIVFDAADWRSPEEREEGGRVYQAARLADGRMELRFGNAAVDFSRIRVGDWVWRTHDPELDKIVRPYVQAAAPVHRQLVRVQVTAGAGEPLRTRWSLTRRPEIEVAVASDEPLAAAQNRRLTVELLRDQFGRLGNTAYALDAIDLEEHGPCFAPASLLNELRRRAVDALQRLQEVRPAAAIRPRTAAPAPPSNEDAPPQLHLLVRTAEQLEAAIEQRPASITLDYLELYGLRPAVEQIQAAGLTARVASPRVLKPSEQRVVHFLQKLGCPIVVRSAGLLEALQSAEHAPLIGDFSLNVANTESARLMLDLGLSRLTPTHDLNAAQVAALASSIGARFVEAIAYQHLPVFHTEHCVFCRFLSTGTSFKDCGHPCEKHRVALADVNGRAHPVMADVGCRNTVFGAEAQEASRHLAAWREAGIHHFRLEFAHESPAQVARVAEAFRRALAGEIGFKELTAALERISPQGTTEGSLFVPAKYLTLPVLQ